MTRKITYLILLLGVSISFGAFSAVDVTRCNLITDSDPRLACYDSLFLKQPESPAKETPETIPPAPEEKSQPQIETIAAPVTIVQHEKVVENQDLGKEQLKTKRPKRSAEHFTARVVKVSKRPRGELIVDLENGQVWVQSSW